VPRKTTTWECPEDLSHVQYREDVRPAWGSNRLDPAFCKVCGAQCRRRIKWPESRYGHLTSPDHVQSATDEESCEAASPPSDAEVAKVQEAPGTVDDRVPRLIVEVDGVYGEDLELFLDLLRATPGHRGVDVRTPEGTVSLELGTSISLRLAERLLPRILPGANCDYAPGLFESVLDS